MSYLRIILGAVVGLVASMGLVQARDIATLMPDDTKTLRRGPADAPCRKGAIDGVAIGFLDVDAMPGTRDAGALFQETIRRTLNGIACEALLVLDSRPAGQIVTNGIVDFALSTGREMSQEHDPWSNGAFTQALIEGLVQGKADLWDNRAITLSELDVFVVNRVKELTDGQQRPVALART